MRTTMSHSPLVGTCMILSLLVCVPALPAANAKRPRATPQTPASAYAEAGLSDPCAAGARTQALAPATESSAAVVPLATLLSRSKNQTASQPQAEQDSVLSKQLWSNRITIPETDTEAANSLALKRLIRQVRSVKFAGKDAGPTFTAPTESEPVASLSKPQSDLIRENQAAEPATASTEASGCPTGPARRSRCCNRIPTRCETRWKWPNFCSSAAGLRKRLPSTLGRWIGSAGSIPPMTQIEPGFFSNWATASAKPTSPKPRKST